MSITALNVITEADGLPVTITETKQHLRVTHSLEDEYIQTLMAAATEWAENYTGRIILDTEVSIARHCFPSGLSGIALPGGIASAVGQIDYTDEDGNPQTLTGPTSTVPGTDYQEYLDDDELAYVRPAIDGTWPATQSDLLNAVTVTYNVGWASDIETPAAIQHAIRFKVADLYVIRDSAAKSNDEKAAEDLLFPYIIQAF